MALAPKVRSSFTFRSPSSGRRFICAAYGPGRRCGRTHRRRTDPLESRHPKPIRHGVAITMRSLTRTAAVLAASALVLAACGSEEEPAAPAPSAPATAAPAAPAAPAALSGSVNLDGSSTVGPFQEVAAELFMEENSGVRVTVAISGTGGGFEKFCNGEDRRFQRVASDQGVGGGAVQDQRHRLRLHPGRERRALGRHQPRQPDHLPHGRSGQPDLGRGLHGHHMG